MYGAGPAKRLSPKRLDKYRPRRASGKSRQATYVGHSVDCRFADIVYERHTGISARALLGATGAARDRAEGFLFVVVNFENFQKARQFQDLASRLA